MYIHVIVPVTLPLQVKFVVTINFLARIVLCNYCACIITCPSPSLSLQPGPPGPPGPPVSNLDIVEILLLLLTVMHKCILHFVGIIIRVS